MLEPQQTLPSFTPVICYPKHALAGKTYLLSIDVRLDEPDLGWTLPKEEYQIFFQLKTQPCFNYRPLGEHEPSVILHRFGGTYGPAEYMLTTAETEIEKGKISVTLINRRGIPIGHTELECSVSSKNERVVEADMATNRPASVPIPGKVSIDKDTRVMGKVDVCVICALPEEAEAFIKVLEQRPEVHFEQRYSQLLRRELFYTTMLNRKNEEIGILVSWQARMGLEGANFVVENLLQEFEPRFVAMPGIYVGNPNYVQLGDLIVADRILIYNTSKLPNKSNQKQQIHNTDRFQLRNDVLQVTRFFSEWEKAVELYKEQRPISKQQQKDWLLSQLFEKQTTIYNLDRKESGIYAPDWEDILEELQTSEQPFINKETGGLLRDRKDLERYLFEHDDFPYQDRDRPRCHIGTLALGNATRQVDLFEDIEEVEGKILGMDIGDTGIYVLQDRRHIPSLVVKGVSNYADGEKDDRYHSYAATISATYVASFISQFVNDEYLPNQRIIPATASLQLPNSSSTPQANEPTKQPVKIFISCSESDRDQRLVKTLNTHLATLSRGESPLIETLDRH